MIRSRRIPAPPERVWEVISAPGNLERIHPFCATNPVRRWPGTGAHDVIEYHNGIVVHRRFTAWHEGRGYDLDVRAAGGTTAVSWRIEPDGRGARLTITLRPHVIQHLPVWVGWAPYLARIRPGFRRYLDSVLRGVEHVATTDTAVTKNQFGHHPWFSSA